MYQYMDGMGEGAFPLQKKNCRRHHRPQCCEDHWPDHVDHFWEGLYAPWKINMEPTNDPIEKEIIFQTSMFGFYLNFPG